MSKEEDLSILVNDIRNGDKDAFNRCFHLMYGKLVQFAYGIVDDRDVAADLVQDVFIKLWGIKDTLEEDKSLAAFLYTMVRNKCLNHIRDYSSRVDRLETEEMDQIKDTEIQPASDELDAHLRKWVEDLPERQRECITMSRFEGLEHQEIAEIIGISARTVNNHIVTALKTLKIKYEQHQQSSMVI